MTTEGRLEKTHCVLNDLLALCWVRGSMQDLSVTRDALTVLGRNQLADPDLPLTAIFAGRARSAGLRERGGSR